MSNEAKRDRDMNAARESLKQDILDWYLAATDGKVQPVACEKVFPYRGKVHWWLEPPVPKRPNPLFIEEYLGDQWTLRCGVLGVDK